MIGSAAWRMPYRHFTGKYRSARIGSESGRFLTCKEQRPRSKHKRERTPSR